ncbi:MAG: ester cyclase [Alphaproteobacteria bacterium]|nr:ester cyclase [Alphaproteobacteria bacterium]
MTQRDDNRSIYLSYHEHCNGHDSKGMSSFYTSPIKVNGVTMDPAAVAAQFPSLFSAFPDWHWEIQNLVADDDYVVGRFTGTGTHRADFQGIAATGRRVTVSEFTLYRVQNGKFSEVWDLAVDGASGFPDAVRRAVQRGETPSAPHSRGVA